MPQGLGHAVEFGEVEPGAERIRAVESHARPAGSKQSQVRDELLALLDELAVGDAIPPERRLAADLGWRLMRALESAPSG